MLLITIALLIVISVAAYFFANSYNAGVIEELRTQPEGNRAMRVMAITFPDGHTLPVNYLREGNIVFAGSDFNWWRSISPEGSRVNLLIKGEMLSGTATVAQDEDYTYEVFERLRPDAPTWASKLVGAKLVTIELD
ncbi:MAG: hypothetical protein MI746_11920 [Pseudomonadales bacterium]|nr:hypothetical protein [Pseudomonadales bacterium]